MSNGKLLSTIEAADYVHRTVGWMAKGRVYGFGPVFVKLGRRVFYDRKDLDGWIEAHKRQSTSDSGLPQEAA